MFNNIKGIGEKKARALRKLNIFSEEDLLFLIPNRYEDKRKIYSLETAPSDRDVVLELKISNKSKTYYKNGKSITKIKAHDDKVCNITFFNDKYTPQSLNVGSSYYVYGKVDYQHGFFHLINPEFNKIDKDYLRLEPVYPLTQGIYQKELRKFIEQAIDNIDYYDFLENSILDIENLKISLNKIHRPNTYADVIEGNEGLLYRKILLKAISINYLRNLDNRNHKIDLGFEKLNDFLENITFSLTEDQNKVLEEIIIDLTETKSMNRLLQGDVGSGKTIVAICAGVLVSNYGQVAFIAPTEILALQHYKKYKALLEKIGIKSSVLCGSMTKKEKENTKKKIKNNEVDFVFGTHALIEDDVIFNKLCLTIVDEQHKFGVQQRNRLIEKSYKSNVLVMSATPIPRTMAIANNGDLNISIINEKPAGRKEIKTYAVSKDFEKRVFNFIEKEVKLSNQVYIVCPSINDDIEIEMESVESIYNRFVDYKPDISTSYLHGEMKADDKNIVMKNFADKKVSVLISTTVVEVGVDVPDASLMIIYNAERFGLSQLHQLRGRVGRSDKDSYCILISYSNSKETRKRMEILCNSNDGFYISEKDLEIRGPGEILGKIQHGVDLFSNSSYYNEELYFEAIEDSNLILEDDPLLEKEYNLYLLNEIRKIIDETSGFILN